MRAGNKVRGALSPEGMDHFLIDTIAEFREEAEEIIGEAERRLSRPGGTKALARALEQAKRSGLGMLDRGPAELDGSDLDLWSALIGSIHWVEALERRLDDEAVRGLERRS
jgi:hypothetical protein